MATWQYRLTHNEEKQVIARFGNKFFETPLEQIIYYLLKEGRKPLLDIVVRAGRSSGELPQTSGVKQITLPTDKYGVHFYPYTPRKQIVYSEQTRKRKPKPISYTVGENGHFLYL